VLGRTEWGGECEKETGVAKRVGSGEKKKKRSKGENKKPTGREDGQETRNLNHQKQWEDKNNYDTREEKKKKKGETPGRLETN